VNRVVLGWEIPTSAFQSVNAIFILLLGPLFSMLWVRLAAAGREPSTPVKFGLGIVQLGLGFGALYYGAVTASSGVVSLVWLILGYMLHTSGELCLSPVGLSMITKLSPLRIGGLMMGVWFLAIAYAQYAAALIAKLTGVHGEQAGDGAQGGTAMIYGEIFGLIALTAIGVGLGILIVAPLLRKLMKGVH
jgi:POT family proton-dependent oligopeptide transporter